MMALQVLSFFNIKGSKGGKKPLQFSPEGNNFISTTNILNSEPGKLSSLYNENQLLCLPFGQYLLNMEMMALRELIIKICLWWLVS